MIKNILPSLFLAACASSSHVVNSHNPKNLDFCLDGSKLLHEIGAKESDLLLWRKNSVVDRQGLRLKSGITEQTSKSIEFIAERTRTQLSNSLAGTNKDQVDDFLVNYLGFCLAEKVSLFQLDGKEYITLDKIKPGSYDQDYLGNLQAAQLALVKYPIEQLVNAYQNQAAKEKGSLDIDLDHFFTFPMSFTYTSMEGATKHDAQKSRKEELGIFFKNVLYSIASFVSVDPIRGYLVKNTPLPPHKDKDCSEIKVRINNLLEQIEGVEPLAAHSNDSKVEQFGKDLASFLYDDPFCYKEGAYIKDDESYDYRLNQSVKSLNTRSELFSLYLLWASSIDISRSADKKTITFNVTVNLPAIFKRFRFESLGKHLE